MNGGVFKLGCVVAVSRDNARGHTSVSNTPPQLVMSLVYYYLKGGLVYQISLKAEQFLSQPGLPLIGPTRFY